MKPSKVFSFVKIIDDSMVASVRIAKFVSETLGVPLCWDVTVDDEPLDKLIIINGAYAFAGNELLGALGRAIICADQVIWVQNDYTIIPPKVVGNAESPFRKAFRERSLAKREPVHYWTTVENMSRSSGGVVRKDGYVIGDKSTLINWNCLTMRDDIGTMGEDRPFSDAMIYYGSFRDGSGTMSRTIYFDRYFSRPSVRTIVSSPSKKFKMRYVSDKMTHVGKFEDLYGMLTAFGLGLYIEDRRSHVEYHSPANRFYEMLSCRLPMVFQPESVTMLRRAGYDVSDFTVLTSENIAGRIAQSEKISETQQQLWREKAIQERTNLADHLRTAWSSL